MIYIDVVANDKKQLIGDAPDYFDFVKWTDICINGFETSKTRLIHSAILLFRDSDIHRTYNERLGHCVKLLRLCEEKNGHLVFLKDKGNSRDRKDFGEALGVAIGVEAIYRSSNTIKPSHLRIIPQTNRSLPDYSITIRGKQITKFETKGLQNGSLKKAVDLCSTQLATSARPKYAFVSRITYNGSTRCKLFIADPEVEVMECSEKEAIMTALLHYGKCMKWAGYYQFAEVILKRAAEIQESDDYYVFNNKFFETELVQKLGKDYSVYIDGYQYTFKTHIPVEIRDISRDVFFHQGGYEIGFFIDENLMNILLNQNFEEILNYKANESFRISDDGSIIDLMEDGTMLYIKVNKEELIEYFNRLYQKLLLGRNTLTDTIETLVFNRHPNSLYLDLKSILKFYESIQRTGKVLEKDLNRNILRIENLIKKLGIDQ